MNEVDVAVFGAGIGGLTTALLCARAGMSVEVHQPSSTDDGLGEVTLLQGVGHQYLRQLQPPRALRRHFEEIRAAAELVRRWTAEFHVPSHSCPAHVIARDGHRGAWLQREAAELRQRGLTPYFRDAVDLPFDTRPVLCLNGQLVVDEQAYREALAAAVTAAGGVVRPGSTPIRCAGHVVAVTGPQGEGQVRARRIVLGDDIHLPGSRPSFSRGILRWEDIVEIDVDTPIDGLGYLVDDRVVIAPDPAGRARLRVARPHHPSRTGSLAEWARQRLGATTVRSERRRRLWTSPDGLPAVGSAGLFAPAVHTIGAVGRWSLLTGTAAGRQLADLFTASSSLLPWSPLHPRGTVVSTVNIVGRGLGLPDIGRRLRRPRFSVDSPIG